MPKQYGRWRVIESVGGGGQAHLFLVEDTKGQHQGRYVLKRLKNQGRLDLFEREVHATTALDHRNVLRVADADVKANPPYYVAERCGGGSLAKQAERFRGNIGATVAVLLPIVDALHAAHAAQVVHRDVKPPNILFREGDEPVLGDFGICHMEGDCRVTLSDEAMGSKDYIAPEMESGRHGPVTGAADVYALGKVMYWMLSGGRIFAREDHRGPSNYLPSLLAGQQWEHVHSLLDGMIVGDIGKRHPITLLPTLLRQKESLVTGGFAPLRPSMGLRCRFCGLGEYRPWSKLRDWLNGQDVKALRCAHCGHVETFQLDGVESPQWWDDTPVASSPEETPRRADAYPWGGLVWPLTGAFWGIVKSTAAGAFTDGRASLMMLDSAVGDPLCGNPSCRREVWPEITANRCGACGVEFDAGARGLLLHSDAKSYVKLKVYAEARAAHMRGDL